MLRNHDEEGRPDQAVKMMNDTNPAVVKAGSFVHPCKSRVFILLISILVFVSSFALPVQALNSTQNMFGLSSIPNSLADLLNTLTKLPTPEAKSTKPWGSFHDARQRDGDLEYYASEGAIELLSPNLEVIIQKMRELNGEVEVVMKGASSFATIVRRLNLEYSKLDESIETARLAEKNDHSTIFMLQEQKSEARFNSFTKIALLAERMQSRLLPIQAKVQVLTGLIAKERLQIQKDTYTIRGSDDVHSAMKLVIRNQILDKVTLAVEEVKLFTEDTLEIMNKQLFMAKDITNQPSMRKFEGRPRSVVSQVDSESDDREDSIFL